MMPFTRFETKLKKLGINITCCSNYPWVYLLTVNGEKVTEKFHSKHNFTLGYYPIKTTEKFKFSNIDQIFKTIRKYVYNN